MKIPKPQQSADGTKLPMQKCPVCGYKFDAASRMADKRSRPSPGDFSVCMSCGEIGVFTDDMSIRQPTVAELLEAQYCHAELDVLQRAIRQHRPVERK